MTTFVVFGCAVIGMVANRVRGGALTNLSWDMNWINEGKESPTKTIGKHLNDLVFGGLFAYLCTYSFNTKFLAAFSVLTISMWVGRSFGWGTYINGIIERKVLLEEEIKWIDKLVLNKTNYPLLRNTAALSLRGLIWTTCLTAGFAIINLFNPISFKIFALPFVGLLMGSVYFLTMEICGRHNKKVRGQGWSLGELFWGFILWGACALLLTVSI